MDAPERNYLKTIMIIATLGGLLFGYDTGVVNGSLPFMAAPDQLDLTPLSEGMVTSSLLLGACFGSVIGGRLSDRDGRKKNIFHLSMLFILATFGCSLSPNVYVMIGCRFVLGLAVGGASVTVPAYLSEISPLEKRGRIVTQNELMIVTGQLLAFVINAILAVTLSGTGHVWRYMLMVASIPAICLFFGITRLPESPRWLVSKDRVSSALEVLEKVRHSKEQAIAELESIQQTIMADQRLKKATLKDLKVPWVRRIVLIGMGIAATTQLTGVNAIMYYGTQILYQAGFSRQASIIANTLNGVTAVTAVCFGMYLMTKINRRTMLMTGFCGTTTSLLLIAVCSLVFKGADFLPFLILILIILFLAFMQSCIGPMLWLLLSEIIPLRLRGLGMGLCVLFHWLTNFVIGLTFPSLMAILGLSTTFFVFVGIGVISICFTKKFVPETKGFTLEEIENKFRTGREKETHSQENISV